MTFPQCIQVFCRSYAFECEESRDRMIAAARAEARAAAAARELVQRLQEDLAAGCEAAWLEAKCKKLSTRGTEVYS